MKLLDRFRSGSFNWTEQLGQGRKGKQKGRVFFGTILTGEKLIDNIDFRDQLLALEPEAIGEELEGVGLYTAAQSERVDWILVKGICDWVDSSKTRNRNRDQKTAVRNAAMFVAHVLSNTRLV